MIGSATRQTAARRIIRVRHRCGHTATHISETYTPKGVAAELAKHAATSCGVCAESYHEQAQRWGRGHGPDNFEGRD